MGNEKDKNNPFILPFRSAYLLAVSPQTTAGENTKVYSSQTQRWALDVPVLKLVSGPDWSGP